jgi:hypothetical protein
MVQECARSLAAQARVRWGSDPLMAFDGSAHCTTQSMATLTGDRLCDFSLEFGSAVGALTIWTASGDRPHLTIVALSRSESVRPLFSVAPTVCAMHCAHCGADSDPSVRRLLFHRAGREIDIHLCEACLADLLTDSGIELRER